MARPGRAAKAGQVRGSPLHEVDLQSGADQLATTRYRANVTYVDVGDLLSRAEGKDLEFKAHLPKPSELARELSALANSGGGKLILGVGEGHAGDTRTPGVDAEQVQLAAQRALMLVHPAPSTRLELHQHGERVIAIINVKAGDAAPVVAQGIAFIRARTQFAVVDSPLPTEVPAAN